MVDDSAIARRFLKRYLNKMGITSVIEAEDVRMALEGSANVSFYGRPGGVVPTPSELSKVISRRYLECGLEIEK